MMEDVIQMVNKNQNGRQVVTGYFMQEDEAKVLLRKGQENDALREQIQKDQRDQLEMKAGMVIIAALLVMACIGGVHTESMSETLAWAMSLPTSLAALLCCLPRAKEEKESEQG